MPDDTIAVHGFPTVPGEIDGDVAIDVLEKLCPARQVVGRNAPFPGGNGGALLAASSLTAEGLHVHGTAFLVAPGVAITAAHTVKAWEEAGHLGDQTWGVILTSVADHELRVWEVGTIAFVGDSDVAILMLRPRFELRKYSTIAHFTLTTELPPEGSAVACLGFRIDPAVAVLPWHAEGGWPHLQLEARASQGHVVDHHLDGLPFLPSPCFVADVISEGGMSGGPVFDERGYVVGIISRSFDAENEDDRVTCVTLCWAATLTELTPAHPFTGPLNDELTLNPEWVDQGWRVRKHPEGGLEYLSDRK